MSFEALVAKFLDVLGERLTFGRVEEVGYEVDDESCAVEVYLSAELVALFSFLRAVGHGVRV